MRTSDRVQLPGWWPTKGDAPRDQYVGRAVCAECHASVAKTQETTAMARTLTTIDQSHDLATHPKLEFRFGPFQFSILTSGTKSVYSVTDGKESRTADLGWAFGAGSSGQTYLFLDHGALKEARVSFFESLNGLSFTPGRVLDATGSLDDAFGRPVVPQEAQACFACHTTASTAGGHFDLGNAMPGVSCEACHGPGAKHVAEMKAMNVKEGLAAIFIPTQLRPSDLVDFCGACHGAPWDVVQFPGMGALSPMRSQPYQLELSPCWGKGDPRITCTGCHDPHVPLIHDASFYDHKCLACHAASGKPSPERGRTAPACKVASKDCVTCHMPKYQLAGMNTKFTNHLINVYPEPQQPAPKLN
jgi:Cytochrome c554 and c-prime